MGSTAKAIAKKISHEIYSGYIDINDYRQAKEDQKDAVLSSESMANLIKEGYDPLHAIYIFGQNLTSVFAEGISELPEAYKYTKAVTAAQDEYIPEGPPISPLTKSYFSFWALYDLEFGKSNETIGSCLLEFIPLSKIPNWTSEIIANMNGSRMGFYLHAGFENGKIILKEIGTEKVYHCVSSSGYFGKPGEIWFTRLCPPFKDLNDYYVSMITPYVLLFRGANDISDYLERATSKISKPKSKNLQDLFYFFMKKGPKNKFWHEYIFCSYSSFVQSAIFIEGIFDIPGSMPHCDGY